MTASPILKHAYEQPEQRAMQIQSFLQVSHSTRGSGISDLQCYVKGTFVQHPKKCLAHPCSSTTAEKMHGTL